MKALTLIALRHPPVDAKGICYGQFDVPLAIDPTQRIAELAAIPELRTASVIWTSPWQRARVVAEGLSRHLSIHLYEDHRLSELGFGRWEGRRFDDLAREEPEAYQRWMENWRTEATPGGETIAQLVGRVGEWLEERRSTRDTIIVVAHAGVLRSLRTLAHGITYEQAMETPVEFLKPELLTYQTR